MNRLELANAFVEQYSKDVKTEYRPRFHVIPPVGWMNDPNGFSFYKGEYHLFYQYHPYFSKWGPMHWAHIKSSDLIRWEWMSVVLAPEEKYDKDGCFSGTGVVDGERHVLMYTGHVHPHTWNKAKTIQQQCIAYSEDGINYHKSKNNPVITTDMLPISGDIQDFRDPKIVKSNAYWYSLIANRNTGGNGQILVYKSKDLEHWTYHGILCSGSSEMGDMWECPDIFHLDGMDVFTISPMYLPQREMEFSNLHSSIYFIGKLDLEKPEFVGKNYFEIDYGLDFYAPQSMETPDGRRVMIGWMQMWDRDYPTEEMKHGWACSMTLPRELRVVEGKLVQQPIEERKTYRRNHIRYTNVEVDRVLTLPGVEGNAIELDFSIALKDSKSFKIQLLKSKEESAELAYSREDKIFTFSRKNIKTKIKGKEKHSVDFRSFFVDAKEKIRLQIFVDISLIEIFIENGKYVSSNTVYPLDGGTGIEFYSDGILELESVDKWDMECWGDC